MKEIKCYIRPGKLDDVLDALHAHQDLPGVTASEVKGFGRSHPSTKDSGLCAPMVKLEIVVADAQVGVVRDIVLRHASTGHAGDGIVFVSKIEESIRIHGAESDAE